jgi:hypothetical protein
MVLKIGSIFVYKSYNGLYYVYRYYIPLKEPNDNSNNGEYVVLTAEEYNSLVYKNDAIQLIEERLANIENNHHSGTST